MRMRGLIAGLVTLLFVVSIALTVALLRPDLVGLQAKAPPKANEQATEEANIPIKTSVIEPKAIVSRSDVREVVHDPAPSALNFSPGDQIIPQSSDRWLTGSDLQHLSLPELRIARNEIYARKGRIFESSDLRRYFSKFSWYRPRFREVRLNRIEAANIAMIENIERAGGF